MKILTTVFFSLWTVSAFNQNNATKQETVDWLKSRLDYEEQVGEKHYHALELIKYDFQNDTLFYKVHYILGGKPHVWYRIDAIPIRDINPDRIRIVDLGSGDDWGIELYVNYGRESIRADQFDSNGNPTITLNEKMTVLYFPDWIILTQGADITERAKKAIQYLIMLAGGKGEKF